MAAIRIIGPGRAGMSFAAALRAAGHVVDEPLGRGDAIARAARGVDVLIIAVPDDQIARVAAEVDPEEGCVVMHLSGSLGCDVLGAHPRRAAMHPLVPMPNAQVGAERLASGVTLCIAGDPVAREIGESLGARIVTIDDADRPAYHAAACAAANHLVALLGQVERIAATVGLPLEAFLGLAQAALDDAADLGPATALTGPASRGDWATIARHLDALDESERAAYGAGVALAIALAGSPPAVPADRSDRPRTPARPARTTR